MSIKITRADFNSKSIVFGIEYKNDVTGITDYKEVVFPKADFATFPPTKVEVAQKLKAELTKLTTRGDSVLRQMKANTSAVRDAFLDVSALKNLDISAIEAV